MRYSVVLEDFMRTDSVRDVLRGGTLLSNNRPNRTNSAELRIRDRQEQMDALKKAPLQLEDSSEGGAALKPPKRSSSPVNMATDRLGGFIAVPSAPRTRSKVGSLIAGAAFF